MTDESWRKWRPNAAALIGWHFFLATDVELTARRFATAQMVVGGIDMQIEVRPLSGRIEIRAVASPGGDARYRMLADRAAESVIHAMGAVTAEAIEREVNAESRRWLDLYALLVPYRVDLELSVEWY